MAKKLYEETDVQDIATAIRSKNGTNATYKVSEMAAAINEISGDGTGSAELAAHIANKNNPHNVTAEQVGADVSGAAATVQSNLNAHSGDTTKHITAEERTKWDNKQDALTFDSTPTTGSNNPITSGGVKEALKSLGTGVGGTDVSLGLTSATVGQIAKIKAVDSDGKPTEWESAAIGSGGSSGNVEAVQTNLDTHIADSSKHVTATERNTWNAKQDAIPYTCVPEAVFYIGDPNESVCEDEITMDNSAFDTIPVPGQLWYDNTWLVWRFCYFVKDKTNTSTSGWKRLIVSEDIKSTKVNTTLSVSNWSDKKYTISDDTITVTSAIELLPRENNGITQAQMEALGGAMIVGGAQADGSIQLVALGDVPTVDIPVTLIIRRDL